MAGFVDNPRLDDSNTNNSSATDLSVLDWGGVPLLGNAKGIVQYVGPTAFLFAVHIIVHPVMNAMRDKREFPKAVGGAYAIVTVRPGHLTTVHGSVTYHCVVPLLMAC